MEHIDERVRELELNIAKIDTKLDQLFEYMADVKTITESVTRFSVMVSNGEEDKKKIFSKLEELEREIAWLKKIAYGAILIASVVAPVAIEFLKRSFVR